ncbi:hypothetical protein, partial [Escherichia coli]|uniref:hypothetical protein n=1 Tax=Escherichia coli TaxID=562 RepID=UPI003F484283
MKNKSCQNCGKFGHWKNECKEPKKKSSKQKAKTQQIDHEADIVASDEELVIVSELVGACTSTTFTEGECIIDFGASS